MVPNVGCIFSIFTRMHIHRYLDNCPLTKIAPLPRSRYTDNCPPRKIVPPPVTVGVWVKVRVSFRVGGQPDNCPREKSPQLGLGMV